MNFATLFVMDILFSHTTALEVLRLPGMRGALEHGSRDIHAVPERAPERCDIEEARRRFPELTDLREPAHVLVDRAAARTDNSFCTCHSWSARHPYGSVIKLGAGLYCASPEQLAVQMAPSLTDLGLIVLLSELFSLYALSNRGKTLTQRNMPATTPRRTLDHLDLLGSVRGSTKVRRLLRLAPAGSASPQETRIALMLSLPPRLGGHGLTIESMNRSLELDALGESGVRHVRKPDILLASRDGERHAAIEYDGALHLTPKRQTQDARRNNEFAACGMAEYRLNSVLLSNFEYMEDLAQKIRRDLGEVGAHLDREQAGRSRARRQALHYELMSMDFSTFSFTTK
ncbi:hypothetical protein [Paratractidigestivibacter sp.]|uniref:hypothetical protein n=2 Tax=Paratractidigestivibacter sp. TaxID=2847316 RepID=UPI002AC8EB14|nr:hypothetical protein [Paratractidigestivibacter sp.]